MQIPCANYLGVYQDVSYTFYLLQDLCALSLCNNSAQPYLITPCSLSCAIYLCKLPCLLSCNVFCLVQVLLINVSRAIALHTLFVNLSENFVFCKFSCTSSFVNSLEEIFAMLFRRERNHLVVVSASSISEPWQLSTQLPAPKNK